jgi:hypothetical protein
MTCTSCLVYVYKASIRVSILEETTYDVILRNGKSGTAIALSLANITIGVEVTHGSYPVAEH